MEKIINKLINESTKGVDIYNHNGSTWLIFTESKQWVIELTEGKTLWYNFNFFKNLFAYASLEVVQNQHLITKWVEDNVMNGSKNTSSPAQTPSYNLTEVIENGVKETCWNPEDNTSWVEGVIKGGVKKTLSGLHIPGAEKDVNHIIENGVKETKTPGKNGDLFSTFQWMEENKTESVPKMIDDVIDKGVIETSHRRYLQTFNLEDTIQDGTENDYWVMDGCNTPVDEAIENGIKEVISYDECKSGFVNQFGYLDDIIENGVKETHDDVYHHKGRIDGVIKNGIKETHPMENSVNSEQWFISEQIVNNHIQTGIKDTKTPGNGDIVSTVQWLNENNATSYPKMIHDVIENGVKEIKPLPSQTGNKDWSEYYHGREDRTKPFNDYLNDTLEMGVKIK
jgi:hypothetical protein